jgi:hypothetical protein
MTEDTYIALPAPVSEMVKKKHNRHYYLLSQHFIACVLAPAVIMVFFLRRSLFAAQEPLQDRPPHLAFQKRPSGQYEFKILQITDIHLGEAENQEWGPRQDDKTWKALEAILAAEAPVDLIVLGGDQLTANNCKNNATAYYQNLGEFLLPYGIPWALIFGNHDDMDFETAHGEKIPAKYSREDLLEVDQRFPLSLTQAGPRSIDGTTNYILDIYSPPIHNKEDTPKEVVSRILFLDSGGGSMEEAITDSQIDWVRKETSKSTVPAMAFQHIPTQSHIFFDGGQCKGLHDDGLTPLDYDGGIIDALAESNRFLFLAVGHDHGNDYCCPYVRPSLFEDQQEDSPSELHLCFGRHTGYGGYGSWERGSRVYQLEYNKNQQDTAYTTARDISETILTTDYFSSSSNKMIRWSSWVRLESGDVIDRFIPKQYYENMSV